MESKTTDCIGNRSKDSCSRSWKQVETQSDDVNMDCNTAVLTWMRHVNSSSYCYGGLRYPPPNQQFLIRANVWFTLRDLSGLLGSGQFVSLEIFHEILVLKNTFTVEGCW